MTTEYEAIKAGTAEAVLHWLETHPDRVEAGVKAAVTDWIELTSQGSCSISFGAENAVTAWLKDNKPAIVRAVAEAAR